ncbi:uncharacterized protein LOC113045763 [Tachysurus ichikawai]
MSRIKQKQPHSPAQPTTRATVSIAGSKKRSNYCDGRREAKYKGNPIRIYPDLSTILSRRRASYNDIKQSLYQKNIQLLYPARLRVTFNEETFIFNTPEEAKQFYDQQKKNEGEDAELTLIQLQMAYFDERIEGLILCADISPTAADVEHTLTRRASPRLILLVAGDEVTLGGWMINIENNIICEAIHQSFIRGLAAVFTTYYVFNLQYQEEAARTLEFVQRCLIGVNPERGTKASRVKVSKKTGKLVQKKAATVNPHVATLIKNLMDFEWGFI